MCRGRTRLAFWLYKRGRRRRLRPAPASPGRAFVIPTARLVNRTFITLGNLVYVAPFASLKAGGILQPVRIGNESNVQDSVVVNATTGGILIGDKVILAHGATVKGAAAIGMTGRCPPAHPAICASFVGFNAVVNGAIVQKDAMVSALARVAPGVTIPSGRKVLSGANVTANSQVAAKSVAVTEADRLFMDGVIEVNREFAVAYTELAAVEPAAVRGISVNPATPFNLIENATDTRSHGDGSPGVPQSDHRRRAHRQHPGRTQAGDGRPDLAAGGRGVFRSSSARLPRWPATPPSTRSSTTDIETGPSTPDASASTA